MKRIISFALDSRAKEMANEKGIVSGPYSGEPSDVSRKLLERVEMEKGNPISVGVILLIGGIILLGFGLFVFVHSWNLSLNAGNEMLASWMILALGAILIVLSSLFRKHHNTPANLSEQEKKKG